MAEFHVGQRVRIRRDIETMPHRYGTLGKNPEMEKLAGQVGTIDEVNKDVRYTDYHIHELGWYWLPEWLEAANDYANEED